MTWEEIVELVDKKVKDHKGRVMLQLRDRASHPLTPEILTVTVPPHVQNPRIDCYDEEGDPVDHIQRHETSF